jgi:glycosyltransferase involved in cell wall biosynthesis
VTVIDFLYNGTPFSGATLRTQSMGGTESSIVQLAEALAKRGHDVCVFNGIHAPRSEFGVEWRPLAQVRSYARRQTGVAVANPKLFNGLTLRSHIFWLHNPFKIWRQMRRGNMVPLFRTRPHFVLLGEYHNAHLPRWFPSNSRTVIHHGVHEDFFRKTPAAAPPPPRAIFTSQPYRGLDWILALWPEIKCQVPAASLDVFAPKAHQAEANAKKAALDGVRFRGSVARPELVEELANARALLIPGHRDETYCLAAAEAIAAGVPIVTLGIGSLSERAGDGKTGFIADSREAFIAGAVSLLSDDTLWSAMHRACLADATLASWDARAEEWEVLLTTLSEQQPDRGNGSNRWFRSGCNEAGRRPL